MSYSTEMASPEVERRTVIASRIAYQFDCTPEVTACPDCDEHYCAKHGQQLMDLIREATHD